APCLRELKALWLDRCEIRMNGAKLFTKKAPFLNGLAMLDLGYNHFGAVGLDALLNRKPKALHTLNLRDNDLSDDGVELLASSSASNSLLELDLSKNRLGVNAARELGSTKHLKKLLVLRLLENSFGATVVAGLRDSALVRRLSVLDLENAPP